MASGGMFDEYDSSDEAAGEFVRGPHCAPKGKDPHKEESVLAWLKTFGGKIAKADYGPMLISAGYDCLRGL